MKTSRRSGVVFMPAIYASGVPAAWVLKSESGRQRGLDLLSWVVIAALVST